MSNEKLFADDGVLIGRNHWDVPVRVELRTYLRFSRRMDAQLRRLVVRWAHFCVPQGTGGPCRERASGRCAAARVNLAAGSSVPCRLIRARHPIPPSAAAATRRHVLPGLA